MTKKELAKKAQADKMRQQMVDAGLVPAAEDDDGDNSAGEEKVIRIKDKKKKKGGNKAVQEITKEAETEETASSPQDSSS